MINFKGKFARGGAVLGLSQVASQFCSLGRNAIIARLISPSDFGIAAVFLLVISFQEMISNLSLDRLLIQSPEGDNVDFQRVAHFLQAIRGILSCGILLLLASPISELFSIPETKNSFYILALMPLLNGFLHLDPRRMERTLRFWPNASVEIASQITMLVLAWPVGKWFGDYRAMLCLLLLKTVATVAGTHLVADRKYGWSRNPHYTRNFFSFGWPLLINSLLMFGILQGDRFILSSAKELFDSSYTMSDVGFYSAAFMLAMMPAMLVINVCSSLFLPVLSQEQNSSLSFNSQLRFFSQGLAVLSLIFGSVMLLTGDKLLPLIYGEQYRVAGELVSWLSFMWAIRILRLLPATISMAKGKTINLMYANFIRILFLAAVVLVVLFEMSLTWIVIVGIVGEFCAYGGALYLNKRSLKIPLSIFIRAGFLFLLGLIVVGTLYTMVIRNMSGALWFMWVCTTVLILPALAVFFLPEARKQFVSFCRSKTGV